MEDTIERIKRRRLEGADHDDLARERRLQAAAISDGPNADLANLILRQRFLAEQQETSLASSLAFQQQRARAGESSLLAAAAQDPVVAQLRQNIFSQQLQQAARFQAAEERNFLAGPSSLYAASLLEAASRPSLSNSLLFDQALENAAAARRGSAVNNEQLRALQMQSLMDAEQQQRGEAVAAVESGGGIRNLWLSAAADSGSQTALLARQLQNERTMVAAGLGVAGPFAGLHSLGHPMGAAAAAAALNRDLLLSRGAANGFLGLPMPGSAMPPPGAPIQNPQNRKRPAPKAHPNTTGRQPIHLFMSCDMDDLSPYQCLVRKQIELFEAQEADAETNARGRNRPIVVGQVGIRCKHCKMLPPRKRERAAIYYPSKLDRLYQAGQTMASVHLGQHCQHIPEHLRQELARLREGKSAALAGKKYWSDGARALGVIEEDDRLFFRKD